jgi:hypothetical protein
MKIKTAWRILAFSAVFGLGLIGCGGDDNPSGGDSYNGGSNNNGGNNNNGGGGSDYVTLGGLKWMTKNLNVETEDSWCYEDSAANCEKYGRLYTWEAAKSACQSVGKRLPSREEWEALETAVGGRNTAAKKLKARNGWDNDGNGTDDFGFSALPGGRYAYYRHMYYGAEYVRNGHYEKSDGFSARCVQDA